VPGLRVALCRECGGYNTREGKKPARPATRFQLPAPAPYPAGDGLRAPHMGVKHGTRSPFPRRIVADAGDTRGGRREGHRSGGRSPQRMGGYRGSNRSCRCGGRSRSPGSNWAIEPTRSRPEIARLVPSTLEGVLLQARTLKAVSEFDLERSPRARRRHDELVTNMIAPLERLSLPPANSEPNEERPAEDWAAIDRPESPRGLHRRLFDEPMTEAERRLDARLDRLANYEAQIDPVLTLLAEHERLIDRSESVYRAAFEIKATLPDDIRAGKVPLDLPGGIMRFASEERLMRYLDACRRLAEVFAEAGGYRDDDGVVREVGLDYVREWSEKAIEDFRAGKAKIEEARVASGSVALFQQGDDLVKQAEEIEDRACSTQAISLAGLLAQIERLRRLADIGDDDPLITTIIAGIKGLVGNPISDEGDDGEPEVIGFGEPEEGGAA